MAAGLGVGGGVVVTPGPAVTRPMTRPSLRPRHRHLRGHRVSAVRVDVGSRLDSGSKSKGDRRRLVSLSMSVCNRPR